MSVDDRLRAAFVETDRTWDDQVPDALQELLGRRRRETVVRRGVAGGLVAAAAVAAVAVAVSQRSGGDPVPAPEPPSPTTSLGAGDETNPLDGTWVSEPVTRADVRRVARLAGDAGDAAAMLAELPAFPLRVVLYVDGDRSYIHTVWRAEGTAEVTLDEENLTVSGNQVVMQPIFDDDDGENVHTFVLEGGTLRLSFVSTTEGEEAGIPGEAWQRLIYDSTAFTSGT